MKYLFVTDMDGTLLNSNSELSDETINGIKNIIKDGHSVILASGRSKLGMKKYYDQLNLNTPMIALNGSVIYLSENKKIETFIDRKILKDLYEKLESYYYILMFNASDGIYSKNHNLELEEIFNGQSGDSSNEIDFSKYPLDNVYNVVTVVYEKHMEDFERYFDNLILKPRLWGIRDGLAYYDLYLSNISKASALKAVLKELEIDENLVYTFGDGVNDTEMLSLTNNGVAMINGVVEAKGVASATTTHSNDEDGVVKHINNILAK